MEEIMNSTLESTKIKNINHAIIYIVYDTKCVGSTEKKDLDNGTFQSRLKKVEERTPIISQKLL